MKRALLIAMLAAGCGDSGFDPPALVLGPRLLAVTVDPPEAAPGEDVLVRAMVASPDDGSFTFEWSVDTSTRALAAGAGQELGESADRAVLASETESAIVPGAETERAAAELLALISDAPAGTPEHVVRLVYDEVGLPLVVSVTVRDAEGAIVAEGFKRLFLTPRPSGTSPPPPRFSVAGTWMSARGSADPQRCVAEGSAPVVTAGSAVVLAPDEDESWLETYRALDIDGRIALGEESAYYSWFSTGGAFAAAVTRAPDRSVEWIAPEEPGDWPVWLVVRDGHLGASACRATVRVEPP